MFKLPGFFRITESLGRADQNYLDLEFELEYPFFYYSFDLFEEISNILKVADLVPWDASKTKGLTELCQNYSTITEEMD